MAPLYPLGVTAFTIKVQTRNDCRLGPDSRVRTRTVRWKGGAPVVHYITYELVGIRLPDETAKIEQTIKSFGDAYQFQKNAWIVEAEVSNHEISAALVTVLRAKDKLLVMRIHKDWTAANVAQEELDWLGGRNYTGVGDPPLFRR
jgi:hypothetical protein